MSHEYTKELFNWQKMLKMINKTHRWLLAVFVEFQCTPWHKTEAHFNGLVQKCARCLDTARTHMQFLDPPFPECPDKLANFARRQLQPTMKCPVCQTSFSITDTDTFAELSSSFHRNRVVEAPTPEASTEQRCNTCSNNNPAASYCLDCRHLLCQSCFEFYRRCETSSECFGRRISRTRSTEFVPRPDPVLLGFNFILKIFGITTLRQWEAKARG